MTHYIPHSAAARPASTDRPARRRNIAERLGWVFISAVFRGLGYAVARAIARIFR
jgi:hypothetical protein